VPVVFGSPARPPEVEILRRQPQKINWQIVVGELHVAENLSFF